MAKRATQVALVFLAGVGIALVCIPWGQQPVPVESGSVDYALPTTWGSLALFPLLALLAFVVVLLGLSPLVAVPAITAGPVGALVVFYQSVAAGFGAPLWPLDVACIGAIIVAAVSAAAAVGASTRRYLTRRSWTEPPSDTRRPT